MLSKQSFARLCCIYSGITFGIYWIPLRAMETTGLSGSWSILLFTLMPAILILPVFLYRIKIYFREPLRFHGTTLLIGLGYVMYAGAFLYTEVIRVIVMFYLMPIWGFLLGRIFLGEQISPVRWISMAFGALGLAVICDITAGFPFPSNTGDWMALVAGFIWANAAILLLTGKSRPQEYTIGFLLWASIIAGCLVAYGISAGFEEVLPEVLLTTKLWWLIPFAIIVLLPAAYATMFGPTQLSPGIVGLLYMTDISIATVTAALFAGETFATKELIGVILITFAGIAEPVYERCKPTTRIKITEHS